MENWASTSNECRARGSSVSYELWLKKVFVLCLVLLSVQKLAWDDSAYKFMENWWCDTVKSSTFVELHFSIIPKLQKSSKYFILAFSVYCSSAVKVIPYYFNFHATIFQVLCSGTRPENSGLETKNATHGLNNSEKQN